MGGASDLHQVYERISHQVADLSAHVQWAVPDNDKALDGFAALFDTARIALVDTVATFDAEGGWINDGARDTTRWLCATYHMDHRDAAQLVDVARLCAANPAANEALHGRLSHHGHTWSLSFSQLAIWARAVIAPRAELFALLAPDLLATTIGLNPKQTAIVVKRWAAIADDELGRGEPDDRLRPGVRIHERADGTGSIRGTLNANNLSLLRDALHQLDITDVPFADDTRTPAQRTEDHLGELARRCTAGLTNPSGDIGAPTHTIVVITTEDDHGTGTTTDGTVVTRPWMDRHTCTAWLQHLTTDAAGEPLNLSRRVRLFTAAQRKAIIGRDRSCRFPGCDAPPHWCDIHHLTHWRHGGSTDLANGVLLCQHHHSVLHTRNWTLVRSPDGTWALDRHPQPPPHPPPDG